MKIDFNQQLELQIPSLRRYARSLIADPVLADDLVQDCLERALSYQSRWTQGSDLRAWLFTLMHNLYVNQIRRWNRSPIVPLSEHMESEAVAEKPQQADLSLQIQTLMNQLPFQQREVLALVAIEGFSYQEVADIAGAPIGTVMSRLHRARESMRQGLSSDLRPELRRIK
ncbi:MAG: sigma-70 family RNA polymerase sigma factor [Motiliproteus sp.]